MRQTIGYRYFLGFRPDGPLANSLGALAAHIGQHRRRLAKDKLHLTLCVIAETLVRDPFLLPRVRAALAGAMLSSFTIRLGRICGGTNGAMIRAIGSQAETHAFYARLIALLAARGVAPLHRKSGLRAHITLGYDTVEAAPFTGRHEWVPDELLLIESKIGAGCHRVLDRWPLLPPAQLELPWRCLPFSIERHAMTARAAARY